MLREVLLLLFYFSDLYEKKNWMYKLINWEETE